MALLSIGIGKAMFIPFNIILLIKGLSLDAGQSA
jgi:hypothetical protein